MFRALALALAAALPLIDLAFARQPAKPGRKVALLVGVNEYTNRNLDSLKFAEPDVAALADELKKAGFEVKTIRGAEGIDPAKKITGKDAYFAALTETLRGVGKADTVLLAFSGHGAQLQVDGKESPFFCPADAVPTDPSTLVSINAVLMKLDEKGGGHNLVLVDACRNVVDPNRGSRGGINGSRIDNLPEGTAVFFSCSGRQKARETDKMFPNDGGKKGHGVFFHFVLEGLRGAPGATDARGRVTWDRLVPFVKEQVKDATATWFADLPAAERQVPFAIGSLGDVPPLADLTKKPDDGKGTGGAVVSAPAAPAAVKITPPAFDGDRAVKRLPEGFTDVAVGGGGRFLIFHMPKLQKLGVFDFNEARVTNYIPLTEADVAFTAGLDCVVVGLKKANRLERWSLTTFEREKSAPPPFPEDISGLLMGHAATGPLVANGHLLDAATFRKLPVAGANKGDGQFGPVRGRCASADGTVFGSWNTHLSPDSNTTFVYEGREVKRYEEGGYRHVVPGPDGRTVYTAKGIASNTLKRGDADDAAYGYCLPAVHGDYFLAVTPVEHDINNRLVSRGRFVVYLRGLKGRLAKLDDAAHGLSFDGWDRESFGPWKRVFFVPDAKVIAVLPASNDQVVLLRFDPDDALEKSGLDYLLVTSSPPRDAKGGAALRYPIRAKSRQGGVTFKLDSGPKGMAVSADGVVTWAVPVSAAGEHNVVLSVRDKSGQEVFHSFTIRVGK